MSLMRARDLSANHKHHTGGFRKRRLLAGLLLLLAASTAGHAAGLSVPAGGVRQMGATPAAAAAMPEDAAATVHNSAGLSRLTGWNFTLGSHLLATDIDYSGEVRRELIEGVGGTVPGNAQGSTGGNWAAPHVYLSRRIGTRFAIGLGLHAPFGTRISYPGDWAGRYHNTRTEITFVALSVAAAWQLRPDLSIGLGPIVQHMSASFENRVDVGYLVADEIIRMVDDHPLASPMPAETVVRLAHRFDVRNTMTLSDTGFGAQAGVLWEPSRRLLIGVAYRSRVRHAATGHAKRPETEDPAYIRRLADTIDDVPVRAAGLLPVRLGTLQPGAGAEAAAQAVGPLGAQGGAISLVTHSPEVVTLSMRLQLAPWLRLGGGAIYTRWSVIQELRFSYRQQSLTQNGERLERGDMVQPMHWRDTWCIGLGVEITPHSRWQLRAGVTHDASPVPNTDMRGPSSPDADRVVLSIGTSWRITPRWTVDLAYAQSRLQEGGMNHGERPAGTGHRFVGRSEGRMRNVGLQIRYGFGGANG